jgi:2-(1,2-epoxy-1,2-dihydrophenyl)acetyl-CoA isomerase
MEETVQLEENDGVATLYLNRPKAYNAFDLQMVRRLAATLTDLALDPGIQCVVISGKGKAFCAGGDLQWIHRHRENVSKAFHRLAAQFHQAILEIRRMPKPVIAAVNGLAAGGGFSLSLSCDFRVMAASAILKQGYTSNGLSIDGGGSFMLPRLLGTARALEIAAFDRPIKAKKALGWGLVTELVDDGKAVQKAVDLAKTLKNRSLDSFAASKKLMTDAFNTSFETHLENERNLLARVAGRPSGTEGLTAFLEKRPPRFDAPGSR